MNDFDKYLEENNIIVDPSKFYYESPIYVNEDRLYDYLNDIIINDKKVMIFGDCDVDGLMCAYQVKETFNSFSHYNYKVWHIKNKKHEIDLDCVRECIRDSYAYVFILDVGTNQMDVIEKLTTFGVKVVVIDHHVSNYKYEDYPQNCVLINTKMNNLVDDRFNYNLSAGALTFTLMYKYGSMKAKDLSNLSICGLISLYSDCIDMDSNLAKSIYTLAVNQPASRMPRFVKDFLGKYSFRRRFIEFTLSPRINSLFRSERFDIINNYFYNEDISSLERNKLIEEMNYIYTNNRKLIGRISDTVPRTELDNFVICNLSKSELAIKANKLYNYTGIIANNIAESHGKPCIVLCEQDGKIKGSFRDLFGRDYLSILSQFCRCGGHPAAFGFHLEFNEVTEFLDTIKYTVDKRFASYEIKENLIIEDDDKYPNIRLLERMAMYNEFCGVSLPPVLIKKRNFMKEMASFKRLYYTYSWGDLTVDSNHKLLIGKYVYIKPVISNKLRLVTVNRVG